MKRIVLCFDGTWNHPDESADSEEGRVETNVSRFRRLVRPVAPDGVVQHVWYDEGVGSSWWNKIPGAFGSGLDHNIVQGYTHLAELYEPGDRVYILGFSRGAYTARSLVGMIRNCGLATPGMAAGKAWMAYGIYRTREDGVDSVTAQSFRTHFAREIDIEFLGVWDTVGSLGIPLDFAARLNKKFYEFHDTELSGIVRNAFHAIALDEHRVDYGVTLWDPKKKPDQTMEQRWFSGAHCDVGGGYEDRKLSDLPLRWMQDRAAGCGLGVEPVAVSPDSFLAQPRDSYGEFLEGLYARLHPRFFRPVLKTQFGSEVIDPSIDRRRSLFATYRPSNAGLPIV